MKRILFSSTRFKVIESSRDFVVIRKDGKENHAHFTLLKDAVRFVKVIEKGKIPFSFYWKKAAKRLLTDEELDGMTEQRKKDRYFNPKKKK